MNSGRNSVSKNVTPNPLPRFGAWDPKGYIDGPNPYVYAGNDPVTNWDPMGTDWEVTVAGYAVKYFPENDRAGAERLWKKLAYGKYGSSVNVYHVDSNFRRHLYTPDEAYSLRDANDTTIFEDLKEASGGVLPSLSPEQMIEFTPPGMLLKGLSEGNKAVARAAAEAGYDNVAWLFYFQGYTADSLSGVINIGAHNRAFAADMGGLEENGYGSGWAYATAFTARLPVIGTVSRTIPELLSGRSMDGADFGRELTALDYTTKSLDVAAEAAGTAGGLLRGTRLGNAHVRSPIYLNPGSSNVLQMDLTFGLKNVRFRNPVNMKSSAIAGAIEAEGLSIRTAARRMHPGSRGNSVTRAQIERIADMFERKGYDVVGGARGLPEEIIPGVNGGRRGSVRIDLTVRNPQSRQFVRINTVDVAPHPHAPFEAWAIQRAKQQGITIIPVTKAK